jgi:hypothetical protein
VTSRGAKAGARPDRLAQLECDRLAQLEWAVALLAAGAALLGLLVVTSQAGALWRDEVNSVNTVSAASLPEFLRLSEFDSFPLLWLLLLRAWIASGAGASDFGLRIFGLLGGLALFLAVGFAALRLTRRLPLASMALLAVNPEIVRWGASVRAWGLGAALAIVSLVLVHEATAQPSRWRVALAALFAVLSVQCVYQNPVLLAAVVAGGVAAALAERRWKRAGVPLAIGMVAAASLLPYVPLFLRVGEWRILAHVPLTLGSLAERAFTVFAASGPLVLACWGVFFGTAYASGVWRLRDRAAAGSERISLLLQTLVPMALSSVGLALFLLRVGHPTESWYYLSWIALLATCAEVAIASALPSRPLRLALVSLTLLVLAAGLPGALSSLSERQTNVDAIALHVEEHGQSGDLVVVNPWVFAISFGRYYHGSAPITTLPPLEDHRIHRYDLVKQAMQAADPIAPLRAQVQDVLEGGGRIWVVGGLQAPAPGKAPPRLPPPPLPGTGWNSEPYEAAWSMEISALLRKHATRITDVDTPRAREYAYLRVFQGWR